MIELNVYGTFKAGPWKNNEAILEACKKGDWNPDTTVLRTFAQSTGASAKVVGAYNCWNFLGAIVQHKPDRINIFTHANEEWLSFSGRVAKGDVFFDVSSPANALDIQFLEEAEASGTTFSDASNKQYTFEQLRAAMTPRGTHQLEIFIYACHVARAGGADLPRRISNFFKASVRASKQEVRYHPKQQGKALSWSYSIENKPIVTNYKQLDPYLDLAVIPEKSLAPTKK